MRLTIDQIVDLQSPKELQEAQLVYAKHEIFHKIADEIPDTLMNGTHTFKLTLKVVVAGFDMGCQKITIHADLERMEDAAANHPTPVFLPVDEFDAIQSCCKYYKPAFDIDRNLIDTCRYHNNPGESWTICKRETCPLIEYKN